METKRIFLDIPSNVEVEKIEMTDSVLLRFIKEEKYEPKEGDICALDFRCSEGVKKLIFCLKSIRGRGCDSINYYFGINGGGDFDTEGHYGYHDKDTIRPATPEEQKQLFDALEEEGKMWDDGNKVVVDIPKKGDIVKTKFNEFVGVFLGQDTFRKGYGRIFDPEDPDRICWIPCLVEPTESEKEACLAGLKKIGKKIDEDGDIVHDFKKGQILYSNIGGCVLVYDSTDYKGGVLCSAFRFKNDFRGINSIPESGYGYTVAYELATPVQAKRMLDYLKSRGKRIDEDGDIVDIKLLVPDHIEIYEFEYQIDGGDGLYIGLDDQLLYYNNRFHVWGVCPLHDGYNRVKCELVKCDRDELKEGDTFLHSSLDDSSERLYNYNKYLKDGKFAHFSSENNGVKVRDYTGGNVYKLKPIDG